MFEGCNNLIGGNGTKFNPKDKDKKAILGEAAKIDGLGDGDNNQGYFTPADITALDETLKGFGFNVARLTYKTDNVFEHVVVTNMDKFTGK